jgi:hypothetical protein
MRRAYLVVIRTVVIVCIAVVCFLVGKPAVAQVQTEADAALNAFNSGFLVQADGQAYYTWGYQQNSLSDVQWGWGQDYNIYPAEDHYEYTHNQSDLNLLNATLNSMLTSPTWDSANGGYLVTTSDGYNDDIGWTIQTFVRGYQFTGNQNYLTQATTDWNFVINNRNGAGGGLDPNGGIWENNSEYSKCALSNSNFVYTGVALYQITQNATYLNGAEAIYAWERKYLVNTTDSAIVYSGPNSQYDGQVLLPGQVSDCVLADSTPQGYADWIYDAGGFLLAADELYRITGNQQYYNDAVMVINHIVGEYNPTGNPPTPLGSSCEGSNCVSNYWFTKGLSEFLTLTNGWWSAPNANWLLANAQAAWNSRNSENLTWNQWGTPTNESLPNAMDMISAASVWSQLPPPTMNLAGTYEIQNVNSGLVLNVVGGNTAPGTEVVQYPWVSGQTNSLWTFVPTSGGYYHIQNASTGQVLNVSAASGEEGALVQQWPGQGMSPGNDQWLPVQNPDGTFSFYNLLSHFALDVPAASSASDVQLDQYPGNFTAAQKFNLIQPNLNLSRTYEIQNANSGLALNVYGGQTANGAEIIQWPFASGATNAEWTFVAASPGYYRIKNLNSGLYLNVSGASTAFGAPIIQWGTSTTNNDRWRVVQNSDGTYSFYNALSSDALDVPAASTASGVQLDQYGENSTPAQKFNLISQ